jgi:uncharacterized membrane protein
MGFVIVIACGLAGFVLGAFAEGGGAGLGFLVGLAFGLVVLRLQGLGRRIDALQAQLGARDGTAPAAAPAAAPARPAAADAAAVHASPTGTAPAANGELPPLVDPLPVPPPRPAAAVPRAPLPPRPAAGPGPLARLARWFGSGNVPVKVGMLVLLAGVGALLKYAAAEGWLRLPIELRLAGVAVAAMAALAFGWRERTRRRSFALATQGGAIGALVLVVFAAFRLYHLLPAGAAFALLLVLVAATGLLAVRQDARALAVLGLLAGFAAPLLVSTGSGNHVLLFGWYALLNLAVVGIALRRNWRVLDLLGFFSTFAIGTAWGVLRYEPALFASTEPFLLLNFAIYLAVPILHARAASGRHRAVDGTLVFGNPLAAILLQAALLDFARLPLAFCALGLAAVYVLLAWRLLRVERLRPTGESFAVLAAGFATLAVPLALSARTTACTFALEGAALVWLGLRQQRRLPQLSGMGLQVLAALAFAAAEVLAGHDATAPAFANGTFIGALLVALGALATAWLYRRAGRAMPLSLLPYLWGLAWWSGAWLHEIDRVVPTATQPAAVLAFLAGTALLAALATRRTAAPATAWTTALALVGGVPVALAFAAAGMRPLSGWGLGALAVWAAGGFAALRLLRDAWPAATVAWGGWLWTWTALVAVALDQFAVDAGLGHGWRAAAAGLPVMVAWALALWRPAWILAPWAQPARRGLLASHALVGGALFLLLLVQAGDTAPLAFVPLANPLELVQLGLLACLARWLGEADAGAARALRVPLLALAGFAFATAATLRGVHQLGGVPWSAAWWDSSLAQAALTVTWSVLGVVGWIAGSRRAQRTLWLAGAVLMALVLAKLLLVDRSHLGNLFGIVSFIAYGLLCTVIGYVAPAPPREPALAAEAAA